MVEEVCLYTAGSRTYEISPRPDIRGTIEFVRIVALHCQGDLKAPRALIQNDRPSSIRDSLAGASPEQSQDWESCVDAMPALRLESCMNVTASLVPKATLEVSGVVGSNRCQSRLEQR